MTEIIATSEQTSTGFSFWSIRQNQTVCGLLEREEYLGAAKGSGNESIFALGWLERRVRDQNFFCRPTFHSLNYGKLFLDLVFS